MRTTPPPGPAGHERGSAAYRRILIALFFAGVATFAQLYSPQGVLTAIAADAGIAPAQASLTVSVSTAGVALSVIPWALLAARIGRARAMTIAVAAAAVLGCAVPFSPTFEVLLAGWLLEGLALGAIPAIAMAYLAEEIVAEHSPRAAGVYVAGTSIGGLSGRIVAGPIADAADWRLGMLAVAALCALAAIAFVVLIPPPRRGGARAPEATVAGFVRRMLAGLRSRRVRVLLAQPFLIMGSFVALYNYIGFRLEAPPFELSATIVSLLYLAYLAGTWSAARVGAWIDRFGRRAALAGSTGVMAAGILLTLVPAVPIVVAGIVVATAGFFAAHAVASAWVPVAAGAAAGEAGALYGLSYYAGSSIVGWAAGLVFAAAGWTGTALALAVLVGTAAALGLTGLRASRAA